VQQRFLDLRIAFSMNVLCRKMPLWIFTPSGRLSWMLSELSLERRA
jgi:hypothetical protein